MTDVLLLHIVGWLVDKNDRPDFDTLASEIAEMAQDPGRYLFIQVYLYNCQAFLVPANKCIAH